METPTVDELMKELLNERDYEIEKLKAALEGQGHVSGDDIVALQSQLSEKTREIDELTVILTAKSAEVDEVQTILAAQKKEAESLEKFSVSRHYRTDLCVSH